MTRDGYAFVTPEGSQERDDDIFIKATKTRGALNGDKVRAVITRGSDGNHRKEGEIKAVLERSTKPFIGVLHIVGGQAWVLMQSRFMPYDISIDVQGDGQPAGKKKARQAEEEAAAEESAPRTGYLVPAGDGAYEVAGLHETVDGKSVPLKARSGMKVAAIVDFWRRGEPNPSGHLVDVLGEMGENDTEMHAILAEYGLPYRFEPEVENAADEISDKITAKDVKDRRDFRDTLTFTIDPADAKDFDDALSFKALDNGNYEVGVHIADVSWYVTPGTVVDKEAQKRGTSVYLVDRTVPMLPEKLSNKLCSLRPNEEKLTFSAVFEITPRGRVAGHWFGRTVIRSDYRFAYETAQQIIDAGDKAMSMEIKGGTDGKGAGDSDVFGVKDGCIIPAECKQAILTLWKLASILRKKRFADGAISFERPEMKVQVDEKGKPIAVYQKVSREANWLIEEFMLLANRSVAEFIATAGKMDGKARKNAKSFVYRIHDVPNALKLSALGDFARNFGYKVNFDEGGDVAQKLNGLLAEAKDRPEFMAIEMLALRSMAKACYSTDNIGHYGLAFKFYTHFTSPIRRYPDTMVHRLLAIYLKNGDSQDKAYYEQQCAHASEREVIAANAERDSIKYKLVEFMEDKIGQEFEGHVSSLTDWGMYVEIEPTKIEGMIALRDIRSDFYEFDEEHYRIIGKRSGKVYSLGDPVKIRVKNTNLDQRILDYELVEEGIEAPTKEKPEAGHGDREARKAKVKAAIQASKRDKKRRGDRHSSRRDDSRPPRHDRSEGRGYGENRSDQRGERSHGEQHGHSENRNDQRSDRHSHDHGHGDHTHGEGRHSDR